MLKLYTDSGEAGLKVCVNKPTSSLPSPHLIALVFADGVGRSSLLLSRTDRQRPLRRHRPLPVFYRLHLLPSHRRQDRSSLYKIESRVSCDPPAASHTIAWASRQKEERTRSRVFQGLLSCIEIVLQSLTERTDTTCRRINMRIYLQRHADRSRNLFLVSSLRHPSVMYSAHPPTRILSSRLIRSGLRPLIQRFLLDD
jgi:hypothetical protein